MSGTLSSQRIPGSGRRIIRNNDGSLNVPNDPVIPFVEGDGWFGSVHIGNSFGAFGIAHVVRISVNVVAEAIQVGVEAKPIVVRCEEAI